MTDRLSLRCPGCRAKLRAPRSLLGRNCPCPRCRRHMVVRPAAPADADVVLVPEAASARGAA